jgi:hypothetical protein
MNHVFVEGYCWYCHRRQQKSYDISPCQARRKAV